MHRIIVFAIPIFALLIAIEFIYGLIKKHNTYRFHDTISSLSQGLLSQVTAVCTQLFQIGLYTLIFPHVALIHNENLWDSWYGWLLAVLLYDFFDYWLHRVGHKSAVFWAAHVVHHQSKHFNFSTALRQESAYALLGWIFYLPLAVAGIPPEIYGIAGLIVLLYQFWIHTEHIGKLGWFDTIFSTPSNHRVHHAVNDRYIDKNYGAILILWDRMFGTFEPETEPCIYGTRPALRGWDPLNAIIHVYSDLTRQIVRTDRWIDKCRILFKPPGWQPISQDTPQDDSRTSLTNIEPGIETNEDIHVLQINQYWSATVLFVLSLVAVGWFLWCAEDMSLTADYLVATGAFGALWGVGAILDNRLSATSGSLISILATCLTFLSCHIRS